MIVRLVDRSCDAPALAAMTQNSLLGNCVVRIDALPNFRPHSHSATAMSLQPFVSVYQQALTPLAPFSWFGLKISSLDLVAAFRLCYVLRHLRENLRDEHTKRRATDSKLPPPEDRSFVRDALTVLTVVYGGEAIAGTSSSPHRSADPLPSTHHPTQLPSSASLLRSWSRASALCCTSSHKPSSTHSPSSRP